jgi:putative tricarboxylic transport membrane protein
VNRSARSPGVPLLVVVLAVAGFGLGLPRLGLPLTVAGVVFGVSFASRDTRAWEAGLLSVGLAVFCWLVFVQGLGLNLPVWPSPPSNWGVLMLESLALGFATALTLQNLGYALGGVLLGTLIGVLPGLGPVATIAMLLPTIYGLDATPALIMLAGIYYGAQYGGSTTAILINVPGEASSVVTALDGYQMARQGRAGTALATAALGSFFAGCVGTAIIVMFAPPLVTLSQQFGRHEYFSLMVLGLVGAVALGHGAPVKSVAMIVLGILLGQVNSDVMTGQPRFSFGFAELSDGISFVVIAMGLFGFGEIVATLGRPAEQREVFTDKVQGLMPTRAELREAAPAVLRGTALGSLLGVLPGGGALLACLCRPTRMEKKIAKDPSRFGKGAIEGRGRARKRQQRRRADQLHPDAGAGHPAQRG